MRAFDKDLPAVSDDNAEVRYAIQNNVATEQMIAEMREKVNQRNKGLSILIDENKAESSKRLSDGLAKLDEGVLDEEIIEKVKGNINTPKDLLDYAKATESIYARLIKQSRDSADRDTAPATQNQIKIGLAFKDGTKALEPQAAEIVINGDFGNE